jgi:hypothetical protein
MKSPASQVVVGNSEVLLGIADDPAEDSYGRDTSFLQLGQACCFPALLAVFATWRGIRTLSLRVDAIPGL